MKKLLVFALVIISIPTLSQFNENFKNKTLRIDYHHSGDAATEYYKLDTLYKEKYWGGSRTNLIDAFDYGHYKFEVYDALTNELLYSRGYSTLFREWQATPEAKTECKSFPETIVLPFPKKAVNVSFYSRNRDLSWEKKFILHIDPESRDIQKHQARKFKTTRIHNTGPHNYKLDIAILAEGYTESEMDKFIDDCQRFKKYILDAAPYNRNKFKINIWAVHSVSEETGTDLPGDDIFKNTVANTNFYTFGSERYLTTEDMTSVRDVASLVPYDQIFILVNHEKYGGGGIYNFYSLGTSDNQSADFLFQHEFGHAFAGLGDEYYSSEVAVEDFYPLDVEPWEPNLTTMVDFGSKWKSMIAKGTPVPTPVEDAYSETLGAFEGGGYKAKGIYRPYIDCTMKSVRYDAFCPVCQDAIQRMIDFYSE